MKRTVLSLAVLGSLVASAVPYTEGWLTHVPKPADTNYLELSGDYHPKSISVITNRPKLKLAMAKSATAALKSTSAPASLDDFEKLLPTADQTRLKELARGLEYDWVKCFDFVRNHIAFSLYPGIMRGAERTLIDREGNDADQSLLLVALLRLSGYEASVIYEPAQIDSWIRSGFALPIFNYNGESPYNVADWLGIKSSGSAQVIKDTVLSRLSKIGYNYATLNTTSVVIPHYWVALKIGDVTQYLDPSLKPSKATFAHDALTDMGYDRDALIAAAGGTTISGMGVRNLSASGIASHLTSLCTNLRNVWTNANEAAEYFVGGKKIVKRTDDAYFHGKYFSDSPIDLSKQTAEFVNALRTKTVLTCNGSAFFEFYLDEVGLRNLWLTSSGSSTVLHLDDTTLTTVSTPSSYYNIEFIVDVQHSHSTTHPYYLTRGDDRVYSLVVGFDGDAKNGMRRCATEKLSRIRATGISSTDPLLTAASLFVQGQQWLAQCAMSQNLLNNLTDDSHHRYYSIGIAGQDGGPFVDMANSFSHSSYGNALVGADMFVSSALEHNVVEQLHDVESVSTIKILNLANQQGESVYFVTSQNVESVVASLSNYSSAFKETMKTETAEGAVYFLPGNGRTTLNDWTGNGYVMRKGADGTISTLMAISGGMNGGFASENVDPDAKMIEVRTNPNIGSPEGITYIGQADPVMMPGGNLSDDEIDFSLNRAMPLIWGRHYSSDSSSDVGIGCGWSGSFDGKVTEAADADSAFGGRSVLSAIPMVVASVVASDLLSVSVVSTELEGAAKRWLAAAMAVKWALDYIPKGTLAFDIGDGAQNFQRCFDGSYVSSPGSTTRCVVTKDGYRLISRRGSETWFGLDKRTNKMLDSVGRETRIIRDSSGQMIRVENDFLASFDFTWSDGHITRVTDCTGRYVEYLYDNGLLVETRRDSGKECWRYVYDGLTRQMLRKTDPLGHCHFVNAYDSQGRVTNQVTISGGSFEFGYACGLLCWGRNPYGHIVRQTCDEDGRTVALQNRYGGMSYSEYNGAGNPVKTINTSGLTTRYSYDGRMNAIKVENIADGLVRTGRYRFDGNDRMVAFTNDVGGGMRQTYDVKNRKIESWDNAGRRTEYVWTDNSLLKEQRSYDAQGVLVETQLFDYNEYGLIATHCRKGVGLPDDGVTEHLAYTPTGMKSSVVNPAGDEWKYTYDSRGHQVCAEDPGGRKCTAEFDAVGNLISTTDSLNRRTVYGFTPSGKISSVLFPDGCMMTNVYDLADNLLWTRDSRGKIVRYEYDQAGGLASSETSVGKISYVKDLSGRTVSVTNVNGVVSYSAYDAFGRVCEVDHGDGFVWQTAYDLQDHPICSVDPDGHSVKQTYSQAGNLACKTRNSGAQECYEYDYHDHIRRAINAEGRSFYIIRDALGRVVAMSNAVGRLVYRANYDKCGNCTSEINGNGEATTSVYNFSGLPTRIVSDGIESRKFYNDANVLVRMERDGAGSIDLHYSVRDRLTNVVLNTRSLTWQIGWGYDAGGFCTNVWYGGGRHLTRCFDVEGRLVSMRDWLGHEWTFDYDQAGHLSSRHSPDGLSDTFTHDTLGRMTKWNLANFQGRTLSRSNAGRMKGERIDIGRMPIIGNRVKRKADFNPIDQVVRVQVTDDNKKSSYQEVYLHDGNGSVTNIQFVGIDELPIAFEYRNGTAVKAIRRGGSNVVTFDTDAGGNRIWTSDTCFIPDYNDKWNRPLVEVDANGSVVRCYIWAGGVLLGIVDEENGLLIARTDPSGNVVVINDMNGDVVYSAIYGPSGEDWGHEGTNPTPFGWQGGYGTRKLPTLGLLGDVYLMGARIYSVSLQRFMSSDPSYVAGGLNFYAYANGNPVANNDPSGLCSEPLEVPEYCTENVWSGRPPDGFYRRGDLVVLDNGSVYVVNEDMAPRITLYDGWLMKKDGGFTINGKSLRNELYNNGREGDFESFEYSNLNANYLIHMNNIGHTTPVVYDTYQMATAGPESVLDVSHWQNVIGIGDEYKELGDKLVPYQPTATQKYTIKNVSHSTGPVAPVPPIQNVTYSTHHGSQNQRRQGRNGGGGPAPVNIFTVDTSTVMNTGDKNIDFSEANKLGAKIFKWLKQVIDSLNACKDAEINVNGQNLDIQS